MAQDYKVVGMTCGGCARSVENAIRRAVPGVQVKVDLEQATVSIEGSCDEALVAEAVNGAGFEFRGKAA